jgi:O-antigen/teichoic acid export membrane protein
MNGFLTTSSIYLFATICSSIIPFLLMPVMTRYLTVAEYGQVAMFQTVVAALSAVVGLSVQGAANRKFFDSDLSEDTLQKFNGACLQILLFSTLIPIGIIFILHERISEFTGISNDWLLLALIVAFTSFLSQIRLGQWQIRNKATYFGVFQISQSILNMLLSLLFVTVLLMGSQGRINAQVIVALVFSFLSIYLLYKDKLVVFFQWDIVLIKEALAFGVPLVPHVVGGFLLLSLDRFVVNKEFGLVSVGIYMVAVQLSSVLKIIFQSINKAYSPWLFVKLKKNNFQEKIKIVKMTYLYFIGLLIVALMAFLIGPYFVVLIAGEKYRAAGSVIGLLCLGNIFNGMYLMVTNYIFYSKKTAKLAIVTICSGSVNVMLLLLLIKPYGLVGAGIAFAVSGFVMFLFAWILAMKCYDMPWFLVFKP